MASRFSWALCLSLTSCLSVVGCSDDPAPVTDAGADVPMAQDLGPTDAGTTDVVSTDAVAVDAGVDVPVATDTPATDGNVADAVTTDGGMGCALTRVLVTTSNFMNGGYAVGTVTPPALMTPNTMSPDQDHIPVSSGCMVFNLLRGNDVLAVLDPANLPTVLRQIPLRPAGADGGNAPYQRNPYDVEVISSSKAYVTEYARSALTIFNPSGNGSSALIGGIDLAPVRNSADTDASGSPEPAEILRVGGRLFVTLQNLASFAPVAPGSLAVVDIASDALVDANPSMAGTQPVVLTARNPVAAVATAGGRIVVAGAGVQAFAPPQMLDGAIEAIDATTLQPVGMRVTEMALGGDLQSLVMLDENRGWAVVYTLPTDAGMRTARVVEFNLMTGAVGATIYTSNDIGSIAKDPTGNVWILDRSTGRAGALVYLPNGTTAVNGVLSTGSLPPYGIAFTP